MDRSEKTSLEEDERKSTPHFSGLLQHPSEIPTFQGRTKKKRIFGVEFKNFKNELMTYISEGSLEAFREFIEVGDQL